jgi:DNA polymerase-3 subunit beta
VKVVVARADLVGAIGKIQSIVSAKPSIPILANILVEAIDDQLVLSATDLSVSMQCSIEAKVVEEGAIALPARRFFQLIRELTSPQVKLHAETSEIAEITTGTSVFKIHGMNKQEFPHLPDLSGSLQVPIENKVLKEALSKTVFSAAREDSRYTLNGVQLTIAKQHTSFIGTDGKRLAKMTCQVEIDASVHGTYVIPIKAIEEMVKMLSDSEEKVKLSLTQDKVSLDLGSMTLIAKLLTGQYPDVERVIPSHSVHRFAIHREELMSLLKQVSLFTSETSHSVKLGFETGQLQLSAASSEVGEGKVSMPVDFSGEPLDIAFNPFFLLDILRHMNDETIRISLTDSHNPGLITDSSNALFVLMPMRLAMSIPTNVS